VLLLHPPNSQELALEDCGSVWWLRFALDYWGSLLAIGTARGRVLVFDPNTVPVCVSMDFTQMCFVVDVCLGGETAPGLACHLQLGLAPTHKAQGTMHNTCQTKQPFPLHPAERAQGASQAAALGWPQGRPARAAGAADGGVL